VCWLYCEGDEASSCSGWCCVVYCLLFVVFLRGVCVLCVLCVLLCVLCVLRVLCVFVKW
jgi:hypothetical protein